MKNNNLKFLVLILLFIFITTSITATVNARTVTRPKPDLTVTNLEIINWNPLKIKVTVKNIGDAPGNEYFLKLEAMVNNNWGYFGGEIKGPLAPGAEHNSLMTITNPGQNQILLNATKLKAIADEKDKTQESNENNNTKEIPVNPPKNYNR
ncbi:MAG: CARDB domain-containing protein [Armatimonadota bacterium]